MNRGFTLRPEAFGGRTGHGVRVAVIDSGIASGHPHVGRVGPGVWIRPDGLNRDASDALGHGTAVAAAIREKAPDAELIPVRVFDRTLATTAAALCDAIVWSASEGARLINLSLGTRNPAHRLLLEAAMERAEASGSIIVAALAWEDEPCFPGSLPGALGVLAAHDCPRDALQLDSALGSVIYASPFPRPIPGVPVEANLSGVSFAVANATGLLACLVEGEPGVRSAAGLRDLIASLASPMAGSRAKIEDPV